MQKNRTSVPKKLPSRHISDIGKAVNVIVHILSVVALTLVVTLAHSRECLSKKTLFYTADLHYLPNPCIGENRVQLERQPVEPEMLGKSYRVEK